VTPSGNRFQFWCAVFSGLGGHGWLPVWRRENL
jgi:hypothetical protein